MTDLLTADERHLYEPHRYQFAAMRRDGEWFTRVMDGRKASYLQHDDGMPVTPGGLLRGSWSPVEPDRDTRRWLSRVARNLPECRHW